MSIFEQSSLIAPAQPRCEACGAEFAPVRSWQKYCSADCRQKHYAAHPANGGQVGTIKSVRKIKTGTSVVVHFTDPTEAERALARTLGEQVRVLQEG